MNKHTIAPIKPDHEDARITLKQFTAMFGLTVIVSETLNGTISASMNDVSAVDGNMSCAAVGFGSDEQRALEQLVACIDGKVLRIGSFMTRPRVENAFYFKSEVA
jgi:hypothetical protein